MVQRPLGYPRERIKLKSKVSTLDIEIEQSELEVYPIQEFSALLIFEGMKA